MESIPPRIGEPPSNGDRPPISLPTSDSAPEIEPIGRLDRLRRLVIGAPRDLKDRSIFHQLSLVPFLAWVGLGADGLSSSAYGPADAFIALGEHRYLAVGLALATALTVLVISAGYRRIIAEFPHGGGGYVVATKLLGKGAGVLSGSALLVDYALTITTSIAAAGDALFSLRPESWQPGKVPVEIAMVIGMTLLNMRGVRESIVPLVPVFLLFLLTHVLLIGGGILGYGLDIVRVAGEVRHGFSGGLSTLGLAGMAALFARAYSLGGGTYTGIEAVSNGIPIMREPKVQTAQRTMVYMATSLALTASGLLLCYILVGVSAEPGKTLNAVLTERVVGGLPGAGAFIVATLAAEALLLVVAAQAGFIDGPRVLSNMALDGWFPKRFSALSDRLTTQNGIVLMGLASLLALLYTGGRVDKLLVMYSINVFVTFSLSMAGMLRDALRRRAEKGARGDIALFAVSLTVCVTILVVTSIEKFSEGGWLTLAITAALVGVCFFVRDQYRRVAAKLGELNESLVQLPLDGPREVPTSDGKGPTAAVLVGGYNGIGIHTLLTMINSFRDYFSHVVFVSAGTIDSGVFKGEQDLSGLETSLLEQTARYVALARSLGLPACARVAIGTDPVDDLEKQIGRAHV